MTGDKQPVRTSHGSERAIKIAALSVAFASALTVLAWRMPEWASGVSLVETLPFAWMGVLAVVAIALDVNNALVKP